MFHRILVPIDGSPTSTKALVTALQLARESGARVRLVYVLDELSYLTGYEYSPELMRHTRGYGEHVLKSGLDIAASAGVPADQQLVETLGLHLGEQVAAAARRFEADLVVVGTHGRRGVGRMLLGSGAEQILRLAPVPVLSVRGEAPPA